MSEKTEQVLSEDEIWKAHILKARSEKISDTNYRKKYQVSVWRFTHFKNKLGFTRVRPDKVSTPPRLELPAFVKAVVFPETDIGDSAPLKNWQTKGKAALRSGVPDPA